MVRTAARASLADTVYAKLRQAILDRALDPGEPLTEGELSRRFHVSRTPVREALAKLERDHLVRVVPKKGAFVRRLSHDEIHDLYEVREVLEALAVRLAAPRIAREELEDFEGRFRELRARGAGVPVTEVQRLGEELHRVLVKRAENTQLARVLDEMREQLRPVWTMSIVAPRRVRALIREHLALIDALKRGTPGRAERLMRVHIRRVRDAIFRMVE